LQAPNMPLHSSPSAQDAVAEGKLKDAVLITATPSGGGRVGKVEGDTEGGKAEDSMESVGSTSGKGKGKGGKSGGAGAKAAPAPKPKPKPKGPAKPQESTFKMKVREGGLQSAGYTVHTSVKGTRTVQWTDGTTRTIPKGYHGDIEDLRNKPDLASSGGAAQFASVKERLASNQELKALIEQHPTLADIVSLYHTGLPIEAIRAKAQVQFGDNVAFKLIEALSGNIGEEASSELKGEPAAMHGTKGDPTWPAPALAAECATLARPGYNSAAAHEYLDADWVLEKKVELLANMITSAEKFVIYAGAGLSTGAGISDYATRTGAGGVLAKDVEKKAPVAPVSPMKAKPSYGHKVIAAMAKKNLIWRFLQQNHDGLPQKAGVPQSVMNEIHGGWFDPSNPVIKMSGTLRGDLFKDLNFCERKTDLVLVLGSSLCGMNADRLVSTVATRARVSSEGKGKIHGSVIVSLQTTPHDANSSVRFFATIDRVMELLA